MSNLCNLYVPFPVIILLRNENEKDSNSKQKLALQQPAEVIVKRQFFNMYGLKTIGTHWI